MHSTKEVYRRIQPAIVYVFTHKVQCFPDFRPRLGPGWDEDLVCVSGRQAGPGVPPGDGDQGDEGKLREVQCRHLQRARDHRLERQLHGAQEPSDPSGQV